MVSIAADQWSPQVVFIDGDVPDLQDLLNGLAPGVEAFVLDPSSDGLQQIANLLAENNLTDVSSISIVGHGASGQIQVGSTTLDAGDLSSESVALSEIGGAIVPGGELQLYSCDTADGTLGQQFVADLSSYVGAPVAASTRDVGQTAASENWTLDALSDPGTNQPGSTAAPAQVSNPFTAAAEANFSGTLSTPTTELWLAATAGGDQNLIIHADDTGTHTASNVGTLFTPGSANNPSDADRLNGIDLLQLDPQNEKYFIATQDTTADEVLVGSLSAVLADPTATPTYTVLYNNPNADAQGFGILGLADDPASQQVFFVEGHTFYKNSYSGSTSTDTTLGSTGSTSSDPFLNGLALDLPHHVAYFVSSTSSTITTTTLNGQPDRSDVNGPGHIIYTTVFTSSIYETSTLTASSGTNSVTISKLTDVSPNLGTIWGGVGVSGFAVDTLGGTQGIIYFVTQTVAGQTPEEGGIFWIDPTDSNHTIHTLFRQTAGQNDPLDKGTFTAIQLDHATGLYYVSVVGTAGEGGAIYVGSLTVAGTPTLFETMPTYGATQPAPEGFALDNAPTLTATASNPTFTESSSNPASSNNTPVSLISAAVANDTDNPDLVSASVGLSGGFSGSNDSLYVLDGATHRTSGTFTGTSIAVSETTDGSGNITLSLSGLDTFANYQTVLDDVRFTSTSENPTNYASNTSRTLSFTVSDGLLSSAPVTSTVTVVGTNDPPVISVGAGNSTSLALTESNVGLSGSNTLTVTDPDDKSQTISTGFVSETGPTNGLSLGGFFSAGTPVSTLPPGETGTITYTFNSGTQAFDYLRAGQQLAITYNVHDTDAGTTGPVQSTDQQVTVTITGTNDPVSITSVTNPTTFTEALDAHAQVLSGSGSLSISDLDVGDTETASVTGNGTAKLDGGALPAQFASNIASLLNSEDLSFDSNVLSNGGAQTINFTYTPTAANLDFLNSTDVLTVTFNAQVNDGTVTSATMPITITVDGTNDAPVITSNGGGATATLSIPENTTAVTMVTASDVDEGDTQTYSIVSTAGTDFDKFTIGSTSGALSFATAPDFENPSHTAGSSQTGDTYVVDVQVSDGHGGMATQDITVDVTNVNEAPAFSQNAVTDAYTENGAALSLLGAITLSDPDNPANFNGGSLTVTITDPVAGDQLDAVGGSGLVISGGGEAMLNGVDLGTVTSGGLGAGSTAIAIALNASATPAEAQALTQAIGYDSTSDDPTGATRNISVVFNDGGNTGSGGALSGSVAVTMDVTAVNDPPTVSAPSSYAGTPGNPITIDGITFGDVDSEGGQEVATFSVAGGALTATASGGITLGGTPAALTATGTIANLNSFISGDHLSFTGATNETLGISIDDQGNTGTGPVGGLTTSTSANIVVDNPPTAPVDSDLTNANQVTEGAAANTYVGLTASSTDVEDGTNLTYSLTANPGGFFQIGSTSGAVSVSAAGASGIDFESSGGAYTITVAATDSDNVSTTSNFTITVVDVAPSVPTDSDATANQVAEGAPANTYVGLTAASTDPNGGTVTYSLSSDPSGFFQINPTTGAVSVSAAGATGIDFETSTSYAVTVEAADPSAQFTTADFTINVLDVAPSVPVDGDGTANQVTEGAGAGTYVGLTASSADPNGGTVIYSLTVNPSNFFQIDPANGRVTVSDAGATGIDFESSGGAYTVTVEAADPSGMSNTANFTINVLDAPPSVPVDSDANANQVAEGAAAGTFVGVTAASTDPNGGTVTYSLSSDPGNFFQIDPSSGAVSVSAAGASGIDFESSGGAYTIAVEAADPSGLFNTANFTINVLDVAPSVPADSDTANANQVTEGAAAGTYVGLTASSTDPNGGAVTYSLSSDPGNFFQIDPMSGAVSVSAAGATGINFESSGGSYAITVEAADPSGAFNTADFTIGVVDVAPSASGFNATAAEAVQGGSPVTLLAAPPPTLGDVNSADLAGATVTISGFQTGDLLSANTAGTNISSSYAGGVLILSGNDTFAAYQDVLASVAYQDTGTDTTTVGHASRSFVWTVTDGTLNSMPPATTTLLVDRPPVTFADTNAATVGGPAVTGNVLGNDSDPDGDPITVTAISDTTNGAGTVGGAALAGQFGALTIASNGAYTYTPDASISAPAGSHATDVFTYTASDGNSGSSTNTLTVTLDRPPAQTMHGVTVVEGTTIGPQSAGDSDPDGDSVTVTALSGGTVGSPLAGTYGTLTLNTNDTFSYTANNTAAVNAAPAGTDPTDTFSYTVSDGNGGTAIEMLAIAVTRPPTISGTVANQSTIAEAPVQPFSGVTMGDPDAAATDTLTITLSSNGTKLGTLSGTGLTGSGATYQLAGTAAAITAELDALTYTPVNGVPGTSVTTDFTLSDQSSVFATPTTDDTTSVIDTDLVNPSPPPGINLPHVTPSNVDEWILVDGEWAASAQPGSIPSGYQVAGTGDFTGNGTSDILWQNPTSGDTQEWLIDNGAWAGTVDLGVHPGNYQIAGIGDFFGNGIDDVLWTSPGTGPNGDTQVDIWQLGSNGQWIASVTPGLGLHPPGYYVVGVDDFTGNGTSDVLWQNPTNGDVDEWQIANGQWTQSVDLGSHPGSGWTISGIGDFFGNGIDDILWTNPGTGPNGDTQVDIWQLGSNGQWADSVTPGLGLHPAGYQVAAVGNFAGNGTDGVLWYDPSNGNVDEWVLANKGQWATSINLGSHPGNFQIAGTGAFVNGNNTSDILWHQNS